MTSLVLSGSMGGMGGMGGGMVGGPGQVVDAHTVLAGWDTGPFSLAVGVVVVATAVWYLRAVGRVRAKGRHWGVGRVASFLAGLVMVELALGSPVATLSMTHFEAHIVQHLLLMIVGPPLLALGAPSTLLLQTADRRIRSAWLRALHSSPFAVLTHPVTVWFLYYGAMFAFFLSPALGYAMDHMAIMDVWNLGFFVGAACFWWPMVGLDPIPRWRMGYGMRFVNLLIGVPFESFLGISILSMHAPIAPMYSVDGTHTGGALLWGMTELLTVIGMVPIFAQWSRADLRQGRREDARYDAELAAAAAAVEGGGAPAVEIPAAVDAVAVGAAAAGPDPAKLRGMAATFAAMRRDPMG